MPDRRGPTRKRTPPSPHLCPLGYLSGLVEAAAGGEFAAADFRALDRAFREDTLTGEDLDVLPLLAPILTRLVPDHPSLGVIRGMRRRASVRAGTADLLGREIEVRFADLGIPTLVSGDLGVARAFYRDPADRVVNGGTVLVPQEVSRAVRNDVVSAAAGATGAARVAGRRFGLERFGVSVIVRSSLAPAFDFQAARGALWHTVRAGADSQSAIAPEVLLLESIYASAVTAPKIRWFTDAVFALGGDASLDWDTFERVADCHAWTAPAADAMRLLAMRGYSTPEPDLLPDLPVDRTYWRMRRSASSGLGLARIKRRFWLAARLARHRGVRSASGLTQSP